MFARGFLCRRRRKRKGKTELFWFCWLRKSLIRLFTLSEFTTWRRHTALCIRNFDNIPIKFLIEKNFREIRPSKVIDEIILRKQVLFMSKISRDWLTTAFYRQFGVFTFKMWEPHESKREIKSSTFSSSSVLIDVRRNWQLPRLR